MAYEHTDKTYHYLARIHRFQQTPDGYTRDIGQADGYICDRTIETAIALLSQGYGVCVDDLSVKERILAEAYEPAYPYWVAEGSSIDRLELRYPRDKQLHSYAYQVGARWNGRTVEISICNSHLLGDLIRLYDFRITEGAKMRMDAWQETLDSATIYRPRGRKNAPVEPPMVDRFRELMTRKTNVINDLCEEDE